jgi:hypothetical protein
VRRGPAGLVPVPYPGDDPGRHADHPSPTHHPAIPTRDRRGPAGTARADHERCASQAIMSVPPADAGQPMAGGTRRCPAVLNDAAARDERVAGAPEVIKRAATSTGRALERAQKSTWPASTTGPPMSPIPPRTTDHSRPSQPRRSRRSTRHRHRRPTPRSRDRDPVHPRPRTPRSTNRATRPEPTHPRTGAPAHPPVTWRATRTTRGFRMSLP